METIGTFGASGHTLGELQLFAETDHKQVAKAVAQCAVVRIPAGGKVEESARARLYLVLKGALSVADADGTISRIHKGESVGEQSVLDDTTNLSAITAVEDSELLVIEPDLVWKLVDESNGIARNLLRLMSFRIRAANAMVRRKQKLGEFYRQLSMNDGLTGLYNRAWLNDVLPNLVASAHAASRPLSLVMIDLDHFKKFNDTHGHLGGDEALKSAAKVLQAALRPSDYAVRYGGEEMMVILPETTENVALMVAERLCKRLQQATVFPDMRIPLPHVTASFGVARLQTGQNEHALIEAADSALYRAKEGGRNRASL